MEEMTLFKKGMDPAEYLAAGEDSGIQKISPSELAGLRKMVEETKKAANFFQMGMMPLEQSKGILVGLARQ